MWLSCVALYHIRIVSLLLFCTGGKFCHFISLLRGIGITHWIRLYSDTYLLTSKSFYAELFHWQSYHILQRLNFKKVKFLKYRDCISCLYLFYKVSNKLFLLIGVSLYTFKTIWYKSPHFQSACMYSLLIWSLRRIIENMFLLLV